MASISFLPGAENDVGEAYTWYQARSVRAAAGFEEAIDNALRLISDSPEQWPLCNDEQHRYYVLKRYPYSVVYRILANGEIVVVAVAHVRRRSSYWKRRV